MKKTAIVLGATGLVGRELVRQLLDDTRWGKVVVVARRGLDIKAEALEEHLVDFDHIEDWQYLLQGHSLFICLGTTLKQAGSKQVMRQIDLDLPIQLATIAKQHQVQDCLVISSLMANANSFAYYLRLKGELEQQLASLQFERLMIFRPGPLLGERSSPRFSEQVVAAMQPLFGFTYSPLKAWRGIRAEDLAQLMISKANSSTVERQQVFEKETLFS
ncbi:NAD(P)H-binding protein [Agarivorans sp. MS3-6]